MSFHFLNIILDSLFVHSSSENSSIFLTCKFTSSECFCAERGRDVSYELYVIYLLIGANIILSKYSCVNKDCNNIISFSLKL